MSEEVAALFWELYLDFLLEIFYTNSQKSDDSSATGFTFFRPVNHFLKISKVVTFEKP